MALSRLAPDSARTFDVWLASPEAAVRLDPAALCPADAVRWCRIRGTRSREEWAASRALLQHLGAPPAENFSLTHSSGHAAVVRSPPEAAAAGVRVGVDLEAIRPRDVLRLARFGYGPEELEQLAALEADAQAERFHLLWTLKEAFAKALGLPLLESLRRCVFLRDGETWRADVPAAAWSARVFRPRASLLLAVVALRTQDAEAGADPPAARALAASSFACADLSFTCHEWPAPREAEWPCISRIRELPIASRVTLT